MNLPGQKYDFVDPAMVDTYLNDDRWVAEQKLDGVRCMVQRHDGHLEFCSHTGRPITFAAAAQHFPSLRHLFADVHGDLVLDAELLADGSLWLFDLLVVAGLDVRGRPFKDRRMGLEVLAFERPGWNVVPQAETALEKRKLWESIVAGGQEGIVVKRLDARYHTGPGRSRTTLKIKRTYTIDVVITARDTDGKNAEYGLFRDGGEKPIPIGGCSMIGKPDVQVGDVAEIRFLYVPDMSAPCLYQPTLLRARPDKPAAECDWSQLAGCAASKEVLTR